LPDRLQQSVAIRANENPQETITLHLHRPPFRTGARSRFSHGCRSYAPALLLGRQIDEHRCSSANDLTHLLAN
jgi:hypothetical protein